MRSELVPGSKYGIRYPQYIMKRFFSLCIILMMVWPTELAAAKSKGYTISARSAIFSDSTKVKRLYGKNVHKKVPPASTTKVMTALLVLEHLPLKKYVTIGPSVTQVQPSKIHLRSGERYRVEDLLCAMLLNSANDAAIVLAEAVSGSHWKFVKLMNQRARQLGARHSQFVNAHGLPTKEKQYTTAYDMYLIFRKALEYSFFQNAIQLKYKTIASQAGRRIQLRSHNKILFTNWGRKVYGKTGYTRAAQACFVGTLKKGSSTFIIAVFGCTRRWEDIKYIVSRYGGITL